MVSTRFNFYREWINIAMYGLKVIVALAPVSMMIYFRENNWVRNLFLFTAGSVLISSVYALAYLAHVRSAALPGNTLRIVVLLFSFAGVITLMGACFSVQTPLIRAGFRWMGMSYLLEFLALVVWGVLRTQHGPYLRSLAFPYLIPIPAYIILFFLCYRAGKSDPGQDQWEAAVDSIGSPDEES
jgi:hypothetical protein